VRGAHTVSRCARPTAVVHHHTHTHIIFTLYSSIVGPIVHMVHITAVACHDVPSARGYWVRRVCAHLSLSLCVCVSLSLWVGGCVCVCWLRCSFNDSLTTSSLGCAHCRCANGNGQWRRSS
jgi:hypothetical protein